MSYKTKPVCYQLDLKNIGKLEKIAEVNGLKLPTFMRFETIKIIKENEHLLNAKS